MPHLYVTDVGGGGGEKMADRYRLETPAFCKCGKSYYRKDALQRHMKECGRVPTLICSLCPYRTFRKDNLMRHSMKHMKGTVYLSGKEPDSTQPPLSQTQWEGPPAESEEPQVRLEEHSDEEYNPDFTESDLDKTTDRRRLENPVGCSICGKMYYWKGALRRHQKECGRVPPMVCSYCDYRTFRKDNLLSHVFRKHNKLQN